MKNISLNKSVLKSCSTQKPMQNKILPGKAVGVRDPTQKNFTRKSCWGKEALRKVFDVAFSTKLQ